MNLSCEIIRDLIPLYAFDDCSPDSRAAVENHLQSCPECSRYLAEMRLPQESPEPEQETAREARAVRHGMRKLRRRWAASILAVLSLIPLAVLILLGVHQVQGVGICYTNLAEVRSVRRFLGYVQDGEYEKAAQMMDFSDDYESIFQSLAEEDTYVSLEIGGEVYWTREALASQYQGAQWANLIYSYNGGSPLLVPEAVWQQYAADVCLEDSDPLSGTVYYLSQEDLERGWGYRRLETQWGVFYASGAYLTAEGEDAAAYCCTFSFVPDEIYQAGKEKLAEDVQAHRAWVQETYGDVLDMTLEEYTGLRQEQLVQALADWAEAGGILESIRYSTAYRINDGTGSYWQVEFSVTEGSTAGTQYRYTIIFAVEARGLCCIGYTECAAALMEAIG